MKRIIKNESGLISDLFERLIAADLQYFPAKGEVDICTDHGVYIIFNPTEIILHVGRSISGKNGLRGRFKNHLYGKSTFSKKYLKPKGLKIRNGFMFKYLVVINPRKRALLEALAIGKLCPKHLGTGDKSLINR